MKVKPKTLRVHAKVSDRFMGSLLDENKNAIHHYDGYVPCDLNIGCGDYMTFLIDLQTGQILNWKPIEEIEVEEE